MTAGQRDETGKGATNAAVGAVKAKCPLCGKPRSDDYRPFCSKRCADIDLGRWLNGSYAIPVTEDADEDGEAAPPPSSDDIPQRGSD